MHVLLQVRCYMGDNEQRWYMWYSGSSKPLPGLAGVAPAAGSIGAEDDSTRCLSCIVTLHTALLFKRGPMTALTQVQAEQVTTLSGVLFI